MLQGVVGEPTVDFLVTFPIARFSRATFVSNPSSASITVYPNFKQKAGRLAGMILEHFNLPPGGTLEIASEIPVGKGLASSSADLVATARAIESCFGFEIPLEQLQVFMKNIEPTDGVMYPGVVSFYHRKVELREYLGLMPALTVVGIDEGGEVDTVEFNKIPKPFTDEDKAEYAALLDALSVAMSEGDVRTIGHVATRSSLLNQKLRPKRTLDDLLQLCDEVEALGVIVAHSGTCLGILLSLEEPNYDSKLKRVHERMSELADEVTIYHSWYQESACKGAVHHA
ncbi:MAG: GHMP family kinase ATP-binding protein [Tumebacillaceae bacterium]